jgi:hypothetical protein
VLLLGVAGFTYATVHWGMGGFDTFPSSLTRTVVVPSSFALSVGVQLILNSFVLSVVSLEHIGAKKIS